MFQTDKDKLYDYGTHFFEQLFTCIIITIKEIDTVLTRCI